MSMNWPLLRKPEVPIDPSTGLPQLPEDCFFRVEPYREDADAPGGHRYLRVSIQRRVQKSRLFGGVKEILVEEEYALRDYSEFLASSDEERMDEIRFWTQSLWSDFMLDEKVRAGVVSAEDLLGDYPPKRLAS